MIDKLMSVGTGIVNSAAPWVWGAAFAVGLAAGVLATRWVMAPMVERAQQKAAQCEADARTLAAAREAAQRRAVDAIARARRNAIRDAGTIRKLQDGLATRAFRDTPADQTLTDIHGQWKKQSPR